MKKYTVPALTLAVAILALALGVGRFMRASSPVRVEGRLVSVEPLAGWTYTPQEGSDVPDSFLRTKGGALLQFSVMHFDGGAPSSEPAELSRQASEYGRRLGWGQAVGTREGVSAWGNVGSATFRPNPPLPTTPPILTTQVWCVMHAHTMVIATLLSPVELDAAESKEAEAIVRGMRPL